MHNEPCEKLRELIVEYGRSLCDDPRRCEPLLKDYCGQYKREIFVLITAMKNRVAEDLLKTSAGVPHVLLLARLIKRLEDELAMTTEAAQWAVESWALALGVIDQPMPVIKPAPAPPTPSVAIPSPPLKKGGKGGFLSVFRDQLRDGSPGPATIVIPAGEFWMGSPESEVGWSSNERRHRVKIEWPFAIGQYAVTFEEYDRFCADRGRTKPEDQSWGRGNRPVINVSWVDALDYTEWLSAQIGQPYRLPTEAEWEYAARAGTETTFWWGNDISPDQANYGGRHGKTVPVDQFQPNPWGLYQVHGNVWEWTGSQYDANYGGAEMLCINKNTDGLFSMRGGSWNIHPAWVRSATRTRGSPAYRGYDAGFRLARSL
ncbi:MAG: formylglycine-generating enzyme family protein [Candidatus Competibacteraceae bacterium]